MAQHTPSPPLTNGGDTQEVTSLPIPVKFLFYWEIYHPVTLEDDKWGVSLLQSKLSNQFIIFGPVDPTIISWSQSVSNVKSVSVMSVTILDLQEQPLLTTSAEKFSDPSTPDKLTQMAKNEGTKRILRNTTVDRVNSKVHLVGLACFIDVNLNIVPILHLLVDVLIHT